MINDRNHTNILLIIILEGYICLSKYPASKKKSCLRIIAILENFSSAIFINSGIYFSNYFYLVMLVQRKFVTVVSQLLSYVKKSLIWLITTCTFPFIVQIICNLIICNFKILKAFPFCPHATSYSKIILS